MTVHGMNSNLISLEEYIEKKLETKADIMEKVREVFIEERECGKLPPKLEVPDV